MRLISGFRFPVRGRQSRPAAAIPRVAWCNRRRMSGAPHRSPSHGMAEIPRAVRTRPNGRLRRDRSNKPARSGRARRGAGLDRRGGDRFGRQGSRKATGQMAPRQPRRFLLVALFARTLQDARPRARPVALHRRRNGRTRVDRRQSVQPLRPENTTPLTKTRWAAKKMTIMGSVIARETAIRVFQGVETGPIDIIVVR